MPQAQSVKKSPTYSVDDVVMYDGQVYTIQHIGESPNGSIYCHLVGTRTNNKGQIVPKRTMTTMDKLQQF